MDRYSWDQADGNANDRIESAEVPLLAKLLKDLRWRSPLGSASDFNGLTSLLQDAFSASSSFLQRDISLLNAVAATDRGQRCGLLVSVVVAAFFDPLS